MSGLEDRLEALAQIIDFEILQSDQEKVFACSDGRKGGRLSFDPVRMFKIRVIQMLKNLFDEGTEHLVNDCLANIAYNMRRFLFMERIRTCLSRPNQGSLISSSEELGQEFIPNK